MLNDRSTPGLRRLRDSVADAGLGDDEAARATGRVGGIELSSEPADVDVQVVTLVAVLRAPDGAKEPAAGQEAAGLADHGPQQLVFARCQVDGSACDGDRPAGDIDDDRVECQPAAGLRARTA